MDTVKDILNLMQDLGTKGSMSEAVGDNTVDNMMDDMSRATNIEVGRFVSSLLNSNLNNFLHNYQLPQHEDFRTAFKQILNRYQVMDGMEQGDLFKKIESMFKNIFIERFGDLGAEIAEMIAMRYAVQMINELKKNAVQANTDMDSDREGVYY